MKYGGKSRNFGTVEEVAADAPWLPLQFQGKVIGRARFRRDGEGVDWETDNQRAAWHINHGETGGVTLRYPDESVDSSGSPVGSPETNGQHSRSRPSRAAETPATAEAAETDAAEAEAATEAPAAC